VVPGAALIATEQVTRDGMPKILKTCTLPLTDVEVVDHIVTELAFVDVTPQGLVLRELAPDITVKDVQSLILLNLSSFFLPQGRHRWRCKVNFSHNSPNSKASRIPSFFVIGGICQCPGLHH
jgi:hypothetical protein